MSNNNIDNYNINQNLYSSEENSFINNVKNNNSNNIGNNQIIHEFMNANDNYDEINNNNDANNFFNNNDNNNFPNNNNNFNLYFMDKNNKNKSKKNKNNVEHINFLDFKLNNKHKEINKLKDVFFETDKLSDNEKFALYGIQPKKINKEPINHFSTKIHNEIQKNFNKNKNKNFSINFSSKKNFSSLNPLNNKNRKGINIDFPKTIIEQDPKQIPLQSEIPKLKIFDKTNDNFVHLFTAKKQTLNFIKITKLKSLISFGLFGFYMWRTKQCPPLNGTTKEHFENDNAKSESNSLLNVFDENVELTKLQEEENKNTLKKIKFFALGLAFLCYWYFFKNMSKNIVIDAHYCPSDNVILFYKKNFFYKTTQHVNYLTDLSRHNIPLEPFVNVLNRIDNKRFTIADDYIDYKFEKKSPSVTLKNEEMLIERLIPDSEEMMRIKGIAESHRYSKFNYTNTFLKKGANRIIFAGFIMFSSYSMIDIIRYNLNESKK